MAKRIKKDDKIAHKPKNMLTPKTAESDKVVGLEVGADDYIKKPFDFDELLIRIQALLRKAYHTYSNEIRVDEFLFDIEKHELYKDEKFIKLSPYELEITKLLFQNSNKTLTVMEVR